MAGSRFVLVGLGFLVVWVWLFVPPLLGFPLLVGLAAVVWFLSCK